MTDLALATRRQMTATAPGVVRWRPPLSRRKEAGVARAARLYEPRPLRLGIMFRARKLAGPRWLVSRAPSYRQGAPCGSCWRAWNSGGAAEIGRASAQRSSGLRGGNANLLYQRFCARPGSRSASDRRRAMKRSKRLAASKSAKPPAGRQPQGRVPGGQAGGVREPRLNLPGA